MHPRTGIARRNLLKGAAALTTGIALQRQHWTNAQDAAATPDPEEGNFSNPVEGKLNISWWSYGGGPWVAANITMIERFQAANPDINIVYQYFPYDVLISKLQAGYNSGTVADMQQMFGTWVTDYAGFGLLDPVPATLAEGYTDRFYEAAAGAYGLNGQYFGMPKENNLENGCMLVNPAILEEAGVTDLPATWQELVDAAVATTTYDDQGRITRAGFQFTDNDSITFLFLAMILQQGATYWADDGIHVNFQTDAAKKAWQDEIDLVTKYHVEDETSYTGDRYLWFFQGNAAMSMRGPWVIPVGEEEFPGLVFDYVNMPPYAGTENTYAAESGWGEVVNVNAAPEVKEAAWKFIEFMIQPDNAREWNLTTYTLPALKALENDPAMLEAAPLLQAAFDVLPYGRWVGPVHNRDRFWTTIHDSFTAVCLGQMDAPTGLTQAEQQINLMIDEMAGP
ncbi:MAG: ABC transporter substrate-binding protein [Chloroflexia bacterium]|nr:ABC transporter substrate-binding protein [Chloroflexia bacterium]